MPSSFPGMDPYLEGYLWSDVHNALASKIRAFLAPQLRPKYAVRQKYMLWKIFPLLVKLVFCTQMLRCCR
ncbi:DUF4058 family protein [Aliinostoc sp. HNIBRCY26]|uniref:DUF4058 family protein n=1 Tax=Aliinostoc sp. HNIBRCY26 TaxID=3418997 RepID=UPI003D00797D